MNILLNLILAFYPALLIFTSIPETYLLKIDKLIGTSPSSFVYFGLHAILFLVIYFLAYTSFKKFLSLRYSSRGLLSIILYSVFFVGLVLLTFYTILPGALIYSAPYWVTHYVLSQPYSLIILAIPLLYLFFE